MSDIFIDFSQGFNGDGTTAASATSTGGVGARNTTDGLVPGENDTWWLRRTGIEKTVVSIAPVNGLAIRGWPISGDDNYDDRPASGTTNGWDADPSTYTHAKMYTATTVLIYISTTVALKGFSTSRVSYANNSTVYGAVNFTGMIRYARFYKCEFYNRYNASNRRVAAIKGSNIYIDGCYFGSTDALTMDTEFTHMYDSVIKNCTFSFGIEFSYSQNVLYSNCSIISKNDDSTEPAITFRSTSNCRFENVLVDNTAYTGATPATLFYTYDTNNVDINMDLKVKGVFGTCTLACQNSNISISPPLSGDHLQFSSVSLTCYRSTINMEYFESNTLAVDFINTVLFLRDCRTPSNNYTITSLSQSSAIYSLNHGGVQGYWKGINHKGVIESSDVYRTGGSPNSLRCMFEEGNSDTSTCPTLGVRNKGEVIYLDLLAGTHTITMYGAHRLFPSGMTKDDLWMEADWVDSNDIIYIESTVTNSTAQLDTDTSVWVGDTDLTPFSMSVTITISTDQKVPVRVTGIYEYVPSAYIYIDPIPVVS